MRLPRLPLRVAAVPAVAALALLAACAAVIDAPLAHAATPGAWPPAWQDPPASPQDYGTPRFDAPQASHCHRLPSTREVPGGGQHGNSGHGDRTRELRRDEPARAALEDRASRRAEAAKSVAPSAMPAAPAGAVAAAPAPADAAEREADLPLQSAPSSIAPRQRPRHETVTAGLVDDNADFGAYLAYRQRNAGLPVRDRDVGERYLLEVTDAAGRPVHDAEVAVQRAGRAEPVMWARTDTAGRAWLHPRAFLAPNVSDRALGVAVRKGSAWTRATLVRGERAALQVRLGVAPIVQRPRLDLVFMVDATGSMGDEIAKLKSSMRAMSQQISQLPGQPDICYGLVAYRDRGDAFLMRTHDFTDELGAFQNVLARVQAGGGGDTPEALNEALHETVHGLSWRTDATRLVVLVADAPPHLDYGGPQYDLDMQAALAKGIKLFAVGASGLDPVGEYIYRQMAQYTAGRFVFLTYKDAADPGSGPGTQTVHDVGNYSVQTLDKLVVKLVGDELARLSRG
ncbi:VWA domain-containing protein [Rhizobacter sp. AJA081-3]|uniref:vWA domain-containing protein n=1 Tax=Rhizobacter sp. AJA081-3 TaxID=2753607 RepID=UPI001AE003DE|nr:vWA domain-containing protein [Rhizobacter sp. AJA081-3]QTN22883.1 VWA domain-containing protein [Rhizobacter sp. AJA081-3]